MLSTGENQEIILFGYIMLLDLAVLALTILRPWSRLLFAAYVGTDIMVAGWWFNYMSSELPAYLQAVPEYETRLKPRAEDVDKYSCHKPPG